MLDTVFFELEGVLADTAEVRRDALLAALQVDGISLSLSEYREWCAGLPLEDAARAAFRLRNATVDPTAITLAALRADRAFRAFLSKGVTLVEGAREVVARLHGAARLGVVTRMSRSEAGFLLSLARLEQAFTCVLAAEESPAAKPSPEPYRIARARLERQRPARPRDLSVALEDGLAGVRAAHGAGILCVVVGDVPAHVAMEADAWIPAVTGLGPERLVELVSPGARPSV